VDVWVGITWRTLGNVLMNFKAAICYGADWLRYSRRALLHGVSYKPCFLSIVDSRPSHLTCGFILEDKAPGARHNVHVLGM